METIELAHLELSLLENTLKENLNNSQLLALVVNQYIKDQNLASLKQLVSYYEGKLDCQESIKRQLAQAFLELNDANEVIHLMVNIHEAASYLLLAKAQ